MSTRLLQAALGAVAGFILAVGFEFLVIFVMDKISGRDIMPRGIGWITVPVIFSIGGWRIGLDGAFETMIKHRFSRTRLVTKNYKIWFALSVVWMIAALGYLFIFSPFGDYWQIQDYKQFFAILLGPPILGFFAIVLLTWATMGEVK